MIIRKGGEHCKFYAATNCGLANRLIENALWLLLNVAGEHQRVLA